MKVINDAGRLKDIEDKLNANFPEIFGEQPKFKSSVASIDFNLFDDESINVLHAFCKEYFNEIYNSSYIVRQKSTFSRLKPILDITQLKNIHTHQIVFFKHDWEDAELHPLNIIPEDGFLKTNLYPKNNYHSIKLSSEKQNKYCQKQSGNQVESWGDLFEKVSLDKLTEYSKSHHFPNHEHLLADINLTVSVSLGEGNDFDGKAGFVLTYEDILNAQPNMKLETRYDAMRYELLKRSQDFIKSELYTFYTLDNYDIRNRVESALDWYTPELSTVFSGNNGGGFFDPYYSGINTLCCTLLKSKLTNSSYNILTGDIPAAFMLYFNVTNLNEGKYEGYYQGQREIPIPKGEFV